MTALRKELRPVHTRIANLVSRAVVSRVDDGTKLQVVQVKVGEDETRDGLERFQQYGLTGVPEPGSEAVVLFVGGRRDVGYVVAVDDRRYRVTGLQPGEVALYNKTGASVVLKANGDVEVNPGPGAAVKLAGETDAVARGAALNSAISTLGAAIGTAVGTVPGGAGAAGTIATAVTTFNASAQSALSTTVKLS